jgi:hypothetical protein
MKNNERLIRHFCLAVVAKSMQHFTLKNAPTGLHSVWHFLFKDGKVKITKQFLGFLLEPLAKSLQKFTLENDVQV